jgi:putative ABC transport system permease protein
MKMRRFVYKLRNALQRNQAETELENEVRSHLDALEEEFRGRGLTVEEARLAAKRAYGSIEMAKELQRDARSWVFLERLLQDVRVAVRSLRKNTAFSVVVIATLALGIGANSAIFSIVNGLLLRPLPYPESDAIVHISTTWKGGDVSATLTVPQFEFVRDHTVPLQAVGGFRGSGTVSLDRNGVPEWITANRVTDGFLGVLGVHPAIGRDIARDDTRPGSPPVAILNDALWRTAFGADPAVIGRAIQLNHSAYAVVGVMPRGFTFLEEPADVFVALPLGNGIADTGTNTHVIARLRPGNTITQAQTNINVNFSHFQNQGLAKSGQTGIQIESYRKWLAHDFRTSVLMLFGAVSFLLLIACANVASLLMARASARQREIFIRLALGSGRLHLLQQFLVESLLLALAGTIAGMIAASWAVNGLLASMPWNIPQVGIVSLDSRVLGFTVLIIAGTTLAFGLTSYWQASMLNKNDPLKGSGLGGLRQVAQNRAHSALVIGEIAASVTLLIGAGLLMESLYNLHRQRLGFNPDGVYTMTTPFEQSAKRDVRQTWEFEQDVLRRLQTTPGVTAAAVVSQLPLSGPDNLPTQHEGHPDHSIGGMEYRAVSPQYFRAMQVPVFQGRALQDSDNASSLPVAVVSETVARAWWPGRNPIGDRIVVGEYQGRSYPEILEQPRQVVGVVSDIKNLSIDEASPAAIYVPVAQLPRVPNSTAWVVRGAGDVSLGPVLRKAVLKSRPSQRIVDIQPMSAIVSRSLGRPSFNASLMGTFAALALALTAVGIYGLLSFQVARRSQEVGIRLALGAKRADIIVMIVQEAAVLTIAGVALGVLGAFYLMRLVAGLLANVHTDRPLVYVAVLIVLFTVALIAGFLPARRASRVDPAIVLRGD